MENAQTGEKFKPVVKRLFPAHYKVEAGKTYHWCACGLSQNGPLCDGSHKGTGVKPIKYVAPETKSVNFCMCKQSSNKPMCDATHVKIAANKFGPRIAMVAVPVSLAGAFGLYNYLNGPGSAPAAAEEGAKN
eukprot:PhM_4_TR15056/c0_g1_i1/m.50423